MRPDALTGERRRGPDVHEYTWQDRSEPQYEDNTITRTAPRRDPGTVQAQFRHNSGTGATTSYFAFCTTRACKARIRPSAWVLDTVVSYILARSALSAVREPPSR